LHGSLQEELQEAVHKSQIKHATVKCCQCIPWGELP